jgi:N-acetylmuramoyl-L-alanine amidase
VSLAAHAAAVGLAVAAASGPAERPPVHWDPIPYDAQRKRDMRAYSRRHYGLDRAGLKDPKVIVEHVAVAATYSAVRNTFAPNVADPELGEKPGVCSHFVVDGKGTIHQLVPLRLMCRHTVGLNHVAIGIEHTGFDDADVLGNVRQLRASLQLTAWLRAREGIAAKDVIGHNESLSSPHHRERVARLKRQTHGDFRASSMRTYRRRLAELEAERGG